MVNPELNGIVRATRRKQPKEEQQPEQRPEGIVVARPDEPKSGPVMSAISGAANLLDLPGSMVRDTIGLHNPFDQLLSPFSDKNRLSGRDLNRQYGLAGKEDTWGNFAGGLGTEVATDPLSWMTLGLWGAGKNVATGAGRSVSKAGLGKYIKPAAEAAGKTADPGLVKQTVAKISKKEASGSLTNRTARHVSTPADILTYIHDTEGMNAAKTALSAMRKSGLTDDMMHTSVGGNFMFNLPFSSHGSDALGNAYNKAFGHFYKNPPTINGVHGAKQFGDLHGEKLASILDDAPFEHTVPKDVAAAARKRAYIKEALAAAETAKLKPDPVAPTLTPVVDEQPATKLNVPEIKAPTEASPLGEIVSGVKARKPKGGRASVPPKPVVTPEAPTTGSVPVMVTRKMEQDLLDRGFSQKEINAMKPAEAWEKINSTPKPTKLNVPTPEQPTKFNVPSPQDAIQKRIRELENHEVTGFIGNDEAEELESLRKMVSGEQPTPKVEAPVTPLGDVVSKVKSKKVAPKLKADKPVEAIQPEIEPPHEIFDAPPPKSNPIPIEDMILNHQEIPLHTKEGHVPFERIATTKKEGKAFLSSPEGQKVYQEFSGKNKEVLQKNAYINALKSIRDGEPVYFNGIGKNEDKYTYKVTQSPTPGHLTFERHVKSKTNPIGTPDGVIRDVRADKDLWKYIPISERDVINTLPVPSKQASKEFADKVADTTGYVAQSLRNMGVKESNIDDLTHDAIAKSLANEDSLSKADSLNGIVTKVAKNKAVSDFRKSKAQKANLEKLGIKLNVPGKGTIADTALATGDINKGAELANELGLTDLKPKSSKPLSKGMPNGKEESILVGQRHEHVPTEGSYAQGARQENGLEDATSQAIRNQKETQEVKGLPDERQLQETNKGILGSVASTADQSGNAGRLAEEATQEAEQVAPPASTTGLGKEAGPTVDAIPKALSDTDVGLPDAAKPQTEKFTLDKLLSQTNVGDKDTARRIMEGLAEGTGEHVDDYVHNRYHPDSKEMHFKDFSDDALFQSSNFPRTQKDGLGFYSKAARVIDKKVQGATSYEQLIKTLENNGVKKEEVEDLGLDAFAGKKKILRSELAEHIEKNTPELIETTKGAGKSPTKYDDYQPGGNVGKDYREFIYSLPGDTKYRSDHWGESNPILHIRTRDRTLPGGKKMLEVMEVQSDWHQQGRTSGYAPTGLENKLKAEIDTIQVNDIISKYDYFGFLEPQYFKIALKYHGENILEKLFRNYGVSEEETRSLMKWRNLSKELQGVEGTVSDAPMKKSWDRMALKRILSLAAKEGYDSVGVVNGKDIANVVGGPKEALGKFYNDKLLNEMKSLTKKHDSYQGTGSLTGSPAWKESYGGALKIKSGKYSAVIDKTSNGYEISTNFEDESLLGTFKTIDEAKKSVEESLARQPKPAESSYSGDFSHFEITPEMRKEILDEGFPLYQNKAIDTKQGATRFLDDGKAVVNTFTGAHDFSTFAHEAAHVARRTLSPDLMSIAERDLRVAGGKWEVHHEEAFARGFERYLRDGKAPTEGLRAVFNKVKEIMSSIYRKLKGSPIENKISPEMKKVYDAMFTPGGNKQSFDEARKVQQVLFQSGKPAFDYQDIPFKSAQAYGELEELIGNTQVMRMGKAIFDNKYMGKVSKYMQDIAAKRESETEEALRRSREQVAPVARHWFAAEALDRRKEFAKLIKLPEYKDMDRQQVLVQAQKNVNKVANGVMRYIEGFSDSLPPEIDKRLGEELVRLKGVLGGPEKIPTDQLAKFLKISEDKAKFLSVRNAKDLAEEAGIPLADAQELMDGYHGVTTGLLGREQAAGLSQGVLDDMFREYGLSRQSSPTPSKPLMQQVKEAFTSLFKTEVDRHGRTEEQLRVNQKNKTQTVKDTSSGEVYDPTNFHQKQIEEPLKDIPGGTALINEIAADENVSGIYHAQRTMDGKLPKVSGANPGDAIDGAGNPIPSLDDLVSYVKNKYTELSDPFARMKANPEGARALVGQMLGKTDFDIVSKNYDNIVEAIKTQLGENVAKDFEKQFAAQAAVDAKIPKLVNFIARLDPIYASTQTPFFSSDIFGVALGRIEAGEKAIGISKILMDTIASNAVARSIVNSLDHVETMVPEEVAKRYKNGIAHETLNNLLKEMGMETKQARKNIVDIMTEKDPKSMIDVVNKIKQDRAASLLADGKHPRANWSSEFGHNNSLVKVTEKGADGAPDKNWWEFNKGDAQLLNEKYGLGEPTKRVGKTSQKFDTLEEALKFLDEQPVTNKEILDNYVLDKASFSELTRTRNPLRLPDELKAPIGFYDKMLNFWKLMHTGALPFLNFHVRNRISGMYANATTDARKGDPKFGWLNPRRYFQSNIEARKLMRGDTLDTIGGIKVLHGRKFADANGVMKNFEDMNPEEQTQALRDLSFILQVTGGRQGISADQVGHSMEGLASQFPGVQPVDPWTGKMSTLPPASLYDRYANPLATKPITGESKWAGEIYGKDLSNYVEGQNRIAAWISLMKQGYSPEAADRVVKSAQVDYTKLSPIERDIFRRIWPFYNFSKGAALHYGQDLLDRPGGITGRTITTAGRAHDKDALVPEHIAETTAIPLGMDSGGNQGFISGLGLGFEDVLGWGVPAATLNFQDLGREAISRSNPLLKGLAEGSLGVSSFQKGPMGARMLEDMDPTIGRTLSNIHDLATGERTAQAKPFISPEVEFAFGLSPFARIGNFAKTITDPRKLIDNPLALATNLGTGIKISQVSEPARLNIEAQRIARELKNMGGRNFSTAYVPDQIKSSMTDEEQVRIDDLLNRLKEIQKRRKELRLEKESKKKG